MPSGFQSIISQLTDFFGGPKLVTGAQLALFANTAISAKAGIVALAGGTLTANTPVLNQTFNSVDTVATNNDSVALPPAIPGRFISIANMGAATLAIFAQTSNFSNSGAADQIVLQTSTALIASTTQATGVKADYFCAKIGVWQRTSIS